MEQIYSVTANKIEELLSPFENNYTNFSSTLKKEDLNIIKSYEKLDDTGKEGLIKNILFLIANPDDISYSTFDFTDSFKESFVIHNPAHFYAALLLNKDVKFQVKGDINSCKTIFGEMKEEELNIKDNYFRWEIDKQFLNDTWGDEEFMLDKLKNLDGRDIMLVLEGMNKDLWLNPNFFNGFYNLNYFEKNGQKSITNYIPQDILHSVDFAKMIKDHAFTAIYYPYIINHCFEHNNKNDDFTNYIQQNIFSNTEIIKGILFQFKYDYGGSYAINKFLSICDKKILSDINIIKTLDEKQCYTFYNFIEPSAFKNPEFFDLFMKNITFREFSLEHKDKLMFWIDDKEQIIKNIKKYNFKENTQSFYYLLDSKLKNDDDIIKTLISSYPPIYGYLPEDKKNDIDIAKHYFESNPPNTQLLFSESILINFMNNDKDFFYDICTYYPKILLKKWCDIEFRKNADLLKNLDPSEVSKTRIKTACKTEDDAVAFVSTSPDFYALLPEQFKSSKKVINIFLMKIDYDSFFRFNTLEQIPLTARLNREVALKIVKYSKTLNYIPEQFIRDKKFILELFKAIDEKQISLKKVPLEISQFFDSAKVNENYSDFLKQYFERMELKEEFKPSTQKKKVSI